MARPTALVWAGTVSGDTWTISSTSTVKNPTGAASTPHDGLVPAPDRRRRRRIGTGLAVHLHGRPGDLHDPREQRRRSRRPSSFSGNMCLKNSANPTAAEITVEGHITLKNSSQIGSAAAPIQKLHTTGCSRNSNGPWTARQLHAREPRVREHVSTRRSRTSRSRLPTSPTGTPTRSPARRTTVRRGSFPGGFDNNTTMDHSLRDRRHPPDTCLFLHRHRRSAARSAS